jgi:adenine phosphoribosyltransferase
MGEDIDQVVGIESRGFILGAAVANALGCGFIPIRKPGKLPSATHKESYNLEYGSDALEIHSDAFVKDARILIVDDVLATGGTARAAVDLVRKVGGNVIGAAFLIELDFLNGRSKLAGEPVYSVLRY